MIGFEHVSLKAGKKKILNDLSFSVNRGELFTIIGPSGSGKTTIFRLIDLLVMPSEGRVLIDGVDTTRIPEGTKVSLRRRMGLVFQKPVPIRGDVFSNIAAGLRFRKVPEQKIAERVTEVLELVGLTGYAGQDAATLSGGEMQRVAIARSIAPEPEILLLDEPTANLDPVSTRTIEQLIESIQKETSATVILSTHDMVQGQRLADRIAVIIDGRMGQVGTSQEIFTQPVNRAVAHMVGVENILDGIIRSNERGLVTVDVEGIQILAASSLPPDTPVSLYLRPEDLTCHAVGADHGSARNILSGRIIRVLPVGPMIRVTVDTGIRLTAVITLRSFEELGLEQGGEVSLSFKATAIHVGLRES
jgi:tungstate transport system ATP-binding protein